MYQSPPTLHIGAPSPKADGLIMVFRNGLLLDEQPSMNPGSGDYFLSKSRTEINFQPTARPHIGDKITTVFESTSGWRRERAVIK